MRLIDADALLDEYDRVHEGPPGRARKLIEQAPTIESEIIRCNNCKHWTQTTENMPGFGLGNCDYLNAKLVNCNGYCYWAERREE